MQGSASNQLSKSQERIYSSQQLVAALKSALAAVRDQLSVLTILDNTASSWPGMQQATDDLEFLIDICGQTTGRMEKDTKSMEDELADCKVEVNTLKETLALQNQGKEEALQNLAAAQKENKQLNAKLDAANKELQQQKQELWTLEKQRADLASETERVKQDNEFMEGEINTLRATVTEQMQQVTQLKEELAARKADASHLKQLSTDQKGQIEHLKRTLDNTSAQLRDTQQALSQAQLDKQHYEREVGQLQDETSRLAAEFTKTSKELERLKDWTEVLKKVEADKLREEQEGRMKDRLEMEAQKAALDKALVGAEAKAAHAEERMLARMAETENVKKQLGLAQVTSKAHQQQITELGMEKQQLTKQRDATQAQLAKLQAQVQAQQMAGVQQEKRSELSIERVRGEIVAEKARLAAIADESSKEAAVQKALAEGWARDLRETQKRLEDESAKVVSLQQRLDDVLREDQNGKMDSFRNAASAEIAMKTMQQQLETQQAEVRRLKAEHSSERKRLEKQIEALQRECNEGAVEVNRLRYGDGPRLPALRAPVTIQDELSNLKKMIGSLPAEQSRLPVVNRNNASFPSPIRAQLTR